MSPAKARSRRLNGIPAYLQPRFGDIVEALLVASLSAAAASWASREALSRTVVVPAGRTLYTYGTAAKIKALQALGIPAKTYLTSAYEVSASRVREILALPGEAEVVAIVDITSPAAFLWRPIAADFGRSGGGDEFITKAHLSFSEARIRAIHSLVRPPEIAALPSAPIQSRRDLLDAQTLPLERRETPTDLMGWRK